MTHALSCRARRRATPVVLAACATASETCLSAVDVQLRRRLQHEHVVLDGRLAADAVAASDAELGRRFTNI